MTFTDGDGDAQVLSVSNKLVIVPDDEAVAEEPVDEEGETAEAEEEPANEEDSTAGAQEEPVVGDDGTIEDNAF